MNKNKKIQYVENKLKNYKNMFEELNEIDSYYVDSSNISVNSTLKNSNKCVENNAIAFAEDKKRRKLKLWINAINFLINKYSKNKTYFSVLKYAFFYSNDLDDDEILDLILNEGIYIEKDNYYKIKDFLVLEMYVIAKGRHLV